LKKLFSTFEKFKYYNVARGGKAFLEFGGYFRKIKLFCVVFCFSRRPQDVFEAAGARGRPARGKLFKFRRFYGETSQYSTSLKKWASSNVKLYPNHADKGQMSFNTECELHSQCR